MSCPSGSRLAAAASEADPAAADHAATCSSCAAALAREQATRVLVAGVPAIRLDSARRAAELAPCASDSGDPAVAAHLPAAIAALPHPLRAALILVDLEGERGADAAAALGIPEGTLWYRVHLARKAVRVALGGEP